MGFELLALGLDNSFTEVGVGARHVWGTRTRDRVRLTIKGLRWFRA